MGLLMDPLLILLLAFLIGVVAGLRTLTAPAAVAWAAHLQWLHLRNTPVALMGSTGAVVIFTLLALLELVIDKRPSTPARTALPGLIGRIVFGGLSGACLAASGMASIPAGALLGAAGGVAGAFGGYQARTRLVRVLNLPDTVIACIEDAVAIGAGLIIVSRF
jgi:uncharacterized membrane protein